jgi:hypothetical protein
MESVEMNSKKQPRRGAKGAKDFVVLRFLRFFAAIGFAFICQVHETIHGH